MLEEPACLRVCRPAHHGYRHGSTSVPTQRQVPPQDSSQLLYRFSARAPHGSDQAR
ncbi:hypothetical protein JOB18_033633 [Solea senegalensis]|uniref:Uncharacterized protein n=1 Tax=Solea senegalensis TaxID=28829 RepID=A0AAV6RPP7_SOLSE|nr:hypothetical protein JOB18_033633 [Solea senegalensis]